ncbi:hypothetical protein FRC12_004766 [Ceratobasidium sp. 428]|nr:hypothetical protein FRC12_004766 [Ceratobasidium sp. 428]
MTDRLSQDSTSQTIPAEILVIVLQILSTSRTESYAPLICSHVCAHWRQAIIEVPSLWSYVDTSRGEGLTRLWLSRSRQMPIDVRFWENPLECDLMPRTTSHLPQLAATASKIELIIESVKNERYRWRSLDIAFCDTNRIAQILVFLGGSGGPLHLDSLTIGPMGSTTLIFRDFSDRNSSVGVGTTNASPQNITTPLSHFEKINVSCDVLRIDSYPIAISPALFSSRLTVLEVFFGGYATYDTNIMQWKQILSQTPNLVDLRLKSFEGSHYYIIPPTRPNNSPLKLPVLKRLELSEGAAWFIDILEETSLPKLESLALHWLEVPRVGDNGLHGADEPWHTVFRSFHLLREVTFSEMGWKAVLVALGWLIDELRDQLRVRLERIWDMDMTHPRYKALRPDIWSSVEFVNCLEGGSAECGCPSEQACGSEDQSNYSDNSSFSHTPGCPSSEETGSDESERSYGEDEDFGFVSPAQEPETVQSNQD